jgi:hypothetical protein
MAKVGEIRTWNFQSDVYGGRYQLVRHIEGDLWEAMHLEPSDEELEAILSDVSLTWEGSARFQEECALHRIENAGTLFQLRIVSSDQFATYF